MASISVGSDVLRLKKRLTRIQKKQIPYALQLTLNDLAFEARKAEVTDQAKQLDRPKPFTQKGFRVKKATKRTLKAEIKIPDNRWKYLSKVASGGASTKSGAGHAIPVNSKLKNKYGGMNKNRARNLAKTKKGFAAKINGVEGVWQRGRTKATRRQLSLQIVFKQTINVPKVYTPWRATRLTVNSGFDYVMSKNLAHALSTAR